MKHRFQTTTNKFIKQHATNQRFWPVWLNGWIFVCNLSGCEFEFHCSHLNFSCCTCFLFLVRGSLALRQLHSADSLWTCMWYDKNKQRSLLLRRIQNSCKFLSFLQKLWLNSEMFNGQMFSQKISISDA